jgi:hypothetical protein
MKLSGDRNQCRMCGEAFNSTTAFDKHRVGEFGVDRRCRTAVEMREIGMVLRGECEGYRCCFQTSPEYKLDEFSGRVLPAYG